MDVRFEDDLAEAASDGNYLMVCSERKTLFVDGAIQAKVPLDAVTSIGAQDGCVLLHLAGHQELRVGMPSATSEEVRQVAQKLNDCVQAWR